MYSTRIIATFIVQSIKNVLKENSAAIGRLTHASYFGLCHLHLGLSTIPLKLCLSHDTLNIHKHVSAI